MLAKLLLLICYFLIVFLVARILDVTASWLEAGCLATHFFDPFTLSVRKLKAILERRGISYNGVVEKNELVDLVEASGVVIGSDLTSQDQLDTLEEGGEKFEFTGAPHFFEEVEDTKAGSWLVEVIPQGHRPSLTPQQWKSLKRKIAWFGIRIGTFRCENDLWLCQKYRWQESAIILSMPQSNLPKGNVIFRTYDSTKRPNVDNVYRWVNSRLSTKVSEINNLNEFRLGLKTELKDNYIYVVLFSTLPEPPMYLTSLSIKFTGRVRFAYYRSLAKQAYSKELRDFGIQRLPTLMLITPEKEFVFGLRKGEQIDYRTMDLFLKTMHPEVNDLFLAALVAVNLSCILEVFIMKGGLLRRTFQLTCLLTFYNTSLILLSLPVIGLFQLPGLMPALDVALKLCRSIMTTDLAAIIRNDFLLCTKYKGIAMFGFVVFGIFVGWMKKKWKCYFGAGDDDTDSDPNADWLTQDLNYFSQLAQSFSHWSPQINYTSTSFEDGFEMLVRRLAVPDLWLQPAFPTDYIHHLPTWSFCCKGGIHNDGDTVCYQPGKPTRMLVCNECAICLEAFVSGTLLLGLPCGHSFHQQCIGMWITSGNSMAHHCCPSCRWPSYMSKPTHPILCQDPTPNTDVVYTQPIPFQDPTPNTDI